MDCEVRRLGRKEIEEVLAENPENTIAIQMAIDISDGSIMLKIINAPLISEYVPDTNTLILSFPRELAAQLVKEFSKALSIKKEDIENALNTAKQDGN